MSGVDIAIVALVLVSAGIGLVRGLVREVFSLAVWVAAFLLSLLFAPRVAEFLAPLIETSSFRYVAAFALLFIATLIVGALVQWLIAQLIDSTGLSGTDRVLGLVFGSARGLLVCTVALIALRPFGATSDWWQTSLIIPELMTFEEDILRMLDSAVDFAGDLKRSNRGS